MYTHILLDKIYNSEGKVGYVYLDVNTQRLFYQTNKNDNYTPRMLIKDMPDHIIEFMLTVKRRERNKEYLKELAKGKDRWDLRDQPWVEIKTVKKYDCIKNKFVTLKEIHFTRPQGVPAYRDLFSSWEDNIQFLTRHGIDQELPMGMLWENVSGNKYDKAIQYEDKDVKNYLVSKGYDKNVIDHFSPLFTAPFPCIERVALDIETRYEITLKPNADNAALPVISIVTKSNKPNTPYYIFALEEERRLLGAPIKKFQKMIDEGKVVIKTFKKERKLLEKFFYFMRSQPQVILTFHGDNFDLPYLKNRALRLGMDNKKIPIHVSTKNKDKNTSKGFTGGIARWRGKIHIDIFKTFDNESIKNYTYQGKYQQSSLDAISLALLGEQKIDIGNMNKATFYELIWYNLVDTKLTLNLTTDKDDLFINLLIALMRLTNTTFPDVNRFKMSTWTHNLIFSYLIPNNILVPNKNQLMEVYTAGIEAKGIIEGAQYRGAQLNIKKGYFFNVLGLDFTGLYPAVCERYNICFSTLNCPHKECKDNIVPESDYWICTKDRGLLADILGILKDVRAKFYKPKGKLGDPIAYAMEQTQKVLANGMIGVFANSYAKLFCPVVSGTVTAYSRHAIDMAEKIAKDVHGLICVYKHTDSTYLIKIDSTRIADQEVQDIMKIVSEKLQLGMEIDNRFKFMIVHQKANYLGVKEKVAKGEDPFVIKGMMGKKRNVPNVIKDTFGKIKQALIPISDEETLEEQRLIVIDIIRQTIKHISEFKGKIEDYTLKTTLNKKPSDYKKTTPQHLKVAKQLADYRKRTEGIEGGYDKIIPIGTIVHYVHTRKKSRVEPSILANIKNINTEKYISLLKSTLSQILENINIDELDLQKVTQTDISTFFG